eukprot:CCRYP_013772-RA/>CCRYP_013772-RA protein AED:0.01 eAED:0.01 QI:3170/1/1/1/0/0/2/1342/64
MLLQKSVTKKPPVQKFLHTSSMNIMSTIRFIEKNDWLIFSHPSDNGIVTTVSRMRNDTMISHVA